MHNIICSSRRNSHQTSGANNTRKKGTEGGGGEGEGWVSCSLRASNKLPNRFLISAAGRFVLHGTSRRHTNIRYELPLRFSKTASSGRAARARSRLLEKHVSARELSFREINIGSLTERSVGVIRYLIFFSFFFL